MTKGIFKPIDYRTHTADKDHIHYGKAITIIKDDGRMYCFAIDDFPDVNYRNSKNRFWARHEEIEITEKGGVE